MSGIELTLKIANLDLWLQFCLDCKDIYYYIPNSLLQVFTFDELNIDELELEDEFCFFSSVKDAHTNFRSLVLGRMRKEAELIGVDLKPLYMDEVALYNSACLPRDAFSPIISSLQLDGEGRCPPRTSSLILLPVRILHLPEPPRVSPWILTVLLSLKWLSHRAQLALLPMHNRHGPALALGQRPLFRRLWLSFARRWPWNIQTKLWRPPASLWRLCINPFDLKWRSMSTVLNISLNLIENIPMRILVTLWHSCALSSTIFPTRDESRPSRSTKFSRRPNKLQFKLLKRLQRKMHRSRILCVMSSISRTIQINCFPYSSRQTVLQMKMTSLYWMKDVNNLYISKRPSSPRTPSESRPPMRLWEQSRPTYLCCVLHMNQWWLK